MKKYYLSFDCQGWDLWYGNKPEVFNWYGRPAVIVSNSDFETIKLNLDFIINHKDFINSKKDTLELEIKKYLEDCLGNNLPSWTVEGRKIYYGISEINIDDFFRFLKITIEKL